MPHLRVIVWLYLILILRHFSQWFESGSGREKKGRSDVGACVWIYLFAKSMFNLLDGMTLLGMETRYWPHPLTLPQLARKKYRRPCINSVIRQLAPIVLWKLFHSFTSRSPTILLKSARDDHCTVEISEFAMMGRVELRNRNEKKSKNRNKM